jgi:hypothetical protein
LIWKKKKSNLVIAAVGDESIHEEWISKNKSFDLFLIYYGDTPDRFKEDADYYLQAKGYKYHLIYDAYEAFESIFSKYKYIWCPDDDLSVDAKEIGKMFKVCEEFDLKVSQPSLTKDSFYSLSIVLNKPNFKIRYTNLVEQMAPVFELESFKAVKETFKKTKSGYGLDWIWPKLLNYENCGIIDLVQIKHTRECKVGELYKKFKKEGVHPPTEKRNILKEYGIHLAICTEISSVERSLEKVCNFPKFSTDRLKFSRPSRRDKGCCNAGNSVAKRLLNFKNLIEH